MSEKMRMIFVLVMIWAGIATTVAASALVALHHTSAAYQYCLKVSVGR